MISVLVALVLALVDKVGNHGAETYVALPTPLTGVVLGHQAVHQMAIMSLREGKHCDLAEHQPDTKN